MSVAAKRTLFGSVVFCALTIVGVHYGQIQESEVRPRQRLGSAQPGLPPEVDSSP